MPPCALLVCAGDFTKRGTWPEIEAFLAWFAAQPAEHRVLIGGNHDRGAELEPGRMAERCDALGVDWLVDREVTRCGLRIWGAPWTPVWRSMAFNLTRGPALAERWAQIPAGLDLLVTHAPPRGVGDRAVLGHVGCDDLRAAVLARPPRLHLFGHIHEARGQHAIPGVRTVFWNVASRGVLGLGARPPVSLSL